MSEDFVDTCQGTHIVKGMPYQLNHCYILYLALKIFIFFIGKLRSYNVKSIWELLIPIWGIIWCTIIKPVPAGIWWDIHSCFPLWSKLWDNLWKSWESYIRIRISSVWRTNRIKCFWIWFICIWIYC